MSIAKNLYRRRFTLRQDHIDLSRRMYVGWNYCETGAPEIDPKCPYGNNFVAGDVAEILGLDEPEEYGSAEWSAWQARMLEIHADMEIAVQIILRHAGEAVRLGRYVKSQECDTASWVFAGE